MYEKLLTGTSDKTKQNEIKCSLLAKRIDDDQGIVSLECVLAGKGQE